jgi:hypothetical protein
MDKQILLSDGLNLNVYLLRLAQSMRQNNFRDLATIIHHKKNNRESSSIIIPKQV